MCISLEWKGWWALFHGQEKKSLLGSGNVKSINNRDKYTVMNFIMRQPYRSPDLAWAAIVFCFHLHRGDSTRSMRISACQWERKWGSCFVNETLTVLWLRLQSCINEKQILITWIELQSCGRCRTKILIDVLASAFYSQSSMTVRDKVMMWLRFTSLDNSYCRREKNKKK